MAGYDTHHGFQLYHTDPSGNFSGWKSYAIGVNNNTVPGQTETGGQLGETQAVDTGLDVETCWDMMTSNDLQTKHGGRGRYERSKGHRYERRKKLLVAPAMATRGSWPYY